MKKLVLIASTLLFFGCSTVTISPEGSAYKISSTPDFQERQHFFLWGLVNDNTIAVSEACSGEAKQLQSQQTFVDGLIGFLTLGIYAPRSAKIWCK